MTADPPRVAPPRGYGNKSREPEDHGQELDTSDGKLVGCSREASWRKDEVCNSKEGPDGGEEHEGDARRDPVNVGIDNCRCVSNDIFSDGLHATYCRL